MSKCILYDGTKESANLIMSMWPGRIWIDEKSNSLYATTGSGDCLICAGDTIEEYVPSGLPPPNIESPNNIIAKDPIDSARYIPPTKEEYDKLLERIQEMEEEIRQLESQLDWISC